MRRGVSACQPILYVNEEVWCVTDPGSHWMLKPYSDEYISLQSTSLNSLLLQVGKNYIGSYYQISLVEHYIILIGYQQCKGGTLQNVPLAEETTVLTELGVFHWTQCRGDLITQTAMILLTKRLEKSAGMSIMVLQLLGPLFRIHCYSFILNALLKIHQVAWKTLTEGSSGWVVS